MLAITGRCNLKCQYCFYADEMTALNDLSTEQWLSFFEELEELAIHRVTLTGGEVFTRQDLFQLIDGIISNRMRYGILSNGTLIDEQTLEKFTVGKRRLRLDYRQHRAWSDDAEIHLTAREMFLLERLAYQPNQVVDTMQLFGSTHGRQVADRQEAGRLLRPIIQTLRSKLKGQISPCIKNVRGRGYMLTDVQVGDRPPHTKHSIPLHTPHTNPMNTF